MRAVLALAALLLLAACDSSPTAPVRASAPESEAVTPAAPTARAPQPWGGSQPRVQPGTGGVIAR